MPGRHSRTGRFVGAALFASVLFAITAAGCEIAIGNDVPAFECVQEAAVCPNDEVCDPSSHQCVAPCSVTGCKAANMQCDPISNVCVAIVPTDDGPSGDDVTTSQGDGDAATQPDEAAPPAETGPGPETGTCRGTACPCSSPSSCDSGICADSAIVPSALYTASGGDFCTTPCCTSADCAAGTVCYSPGGYAPGVGASYCVNPTWMQRSAPGSGLGGAACTTGRDCRSGLCAGNTCADTCCSTAASSTECSSGNQCRFGTFPGTPAFDQNYVASCGHGGTRGNGQTCQLNSDCQSALCNGTNCANACRNTAECAGSGQACAYIGPANSNSTIAACYAGPPTPGTGTQGASCGTDGDCQSLFCDTTSKQCSDVCFANSDCTKSGWRCRPESVQIPGGAGSVWVLLCGL
jgi:hypothetical protein